MLTINIYKRKYQMPESWNELSGKQLIEVSRILNRKDLTENDLVHLFGICVGMSKRKFYSYSYLPKWLSSKIFYKKVEVLLFISRSLYLLDFLLKENTLTNQ